MIEIFDSNKVKKQAKRRLILHLVLISLLLIAVISGSIVLLLLSTLDYLWNLIVTIVICCLTFTFVLFYFLNIFPIVSHYYFFYKRMNETAYERHIGVKYLEEQTNKVINNVKYRSLYFAYQERQTTYHQSMYVLDNDVTFNPGDILKVVTYKNVIVKYEVIGHADVQ